MLIMSTKPLTASAASESGKQCERPNTIMRRRTPPTTTSSVCPACRCSGRRATHDPGDQRADGGRAAQHAEPDGPVCRICARTAAAARRRRRRARRTGRAGSRRACIGVWRMKRIPAKRLASRRRRRSGMRSGGLAGIASSSRERDREQHGRDHVDELGRDREEQAAERRAGDHPDLEGDRAQRHRARQQLERERARAGARGPTGCAIAAATPVAAARARNGQSCVAPSSVTASRSDHDGESSADGDRKHEPPREAVGKLACRQREQEQRNELASPISPRSNADWLIA